METQHNFGKSEPCIIDCDAVVTGKRDFEAAPQAIAVDDSHNRHAEPIEVIDDGMRPAQATLGRFGIRHAAEFTDVRTGNETAFFPGAQDYSRRRLALDVRERIVELDQHLLTERVGARSRLVEDEPGKPIVVAGKLPMAPRAARLA